MGVKSTYEKLRTRVIAGLTGQIHQDTTHAQESQFRLRGSGTTTRSDRSTDSNAGLDYGDHFQEEPQNPGREILEEANMNAMTSAYTLPIPRHRNWADGVFYERSDSPERFNHGNGDIPYSAEDKYMHQNNVNAFSAHPASGVSGEWNAAQQAQADTGMANTLLFQNVPADNDDPEFNVWGASNPMAYPNGDNLPPPHASPMTTSLESYKFKNAAAWLNGKDATVYGGDAHTIHESPSYYSHARPAAAELAGANTARLREGDAVIAVMGVTGSGKSSFISTLTGQAQIGHTLNSCTTSVSLHPFTDRQSGRTITLVDTPGFDDTSRSDADVFKAIVAFLADLYVRKVRLLGIAYLHRISDTRVQGSARKSLEILRLLYGNGDGARGGTRGVVFVSTMWDQLPPGRAGAVLGERREAELRRRFWGNMLTRQEQVVRYCSGDRAAAETVVWEIDKEAWRMGPVVLQIQHEVVDEHKQLDQTAAGIFITREMKEAQRKHEAEMAQYKAAILEAERDRETAEELQRELKALEAKGQQQLQGVRGLHISLPKLADERRNASLLGQHSPKRLTWQPAAT